MANCGLGTKLSFFLVGIGVGAVVAILCAPNSGKQTRKLLAKKAVEGKDYVATKGREFIGEAGERLADTLEAGKAAAKSTFLRQ
jgi:gas vesicle protein